MSVEKGSLEFCFMLSLLRESLNLAGLPEFNQKNSSVSIDWIEFERLLWEHRVVFPVWRELNRNGKIDWIPDSCRNRLSSLNKQFSLRQMHRTSILLKVVKAFDRAGISYVTLKGPALSQLLYGDPLQRHSNDLDLLVKRDQFDWAEQVLADLGISRNFEAIDERESRGAEVWHIAYHKHYSGLGIGLELHWRLSGIDCFFPVSADRILESSSEVEVAGYPVAIIGNEYLADYLTLHGSAHCWNRMKWIYEMACLRRAKAQFVDFHPDQSDSFTGNRKWRNDLLDCLFARELEPSSVGLAAGMSLKQLATPNLYPGSFGNVVRRSFALLWVGRGFSCRWKYFFQLLSWKPCYLRFPLPERWAFLYSVMGPVYWLYLQVFPSKKRG